MNILHLSYLDNEGGSARGAYRLHTAFREIGWRSQMVVRHRKTHDPDVHLITFGALETADRLTGSVADAFSLESACYPSSWALQWRSLFRESQILQLYNLHGSYFSVNALPSLSKHLPIVWQIDDMSAFTGHCAYSYECVRYLTGCGACPHLENPVPLVRDTTALLWKMKKRAYARSRLQIVAPSRWMEKCVRSSPLLGGFPVHRIPYGINLETFRPMRQSAREVLALPRDRTVVLFAADNVQQPRKGAHFFVEALHSVSPELRQKLTVVFVGYSSRRLVLPSDLQVRHFGAIKDDLLMATLYAAADLTVSTSLADNLPNVILESMAAGTPVLAFDVGGISDAVRHLETGFLVKASSVESLTAGLKTLVDSPELLSRLGFHAREVAEMEYGIAEQVQRFKELYSDMIGQNAASQVAGKLVPAQIDQ